VLGGDQELAVFFRTLTGDGVLGAAPIFDSLARRLVCAYQFEQIGIIPGATAEVGSVFGPPKQEPGQPSFLNMLHGTPPWVKQGRPVIRIA
jgi:hypothetical protein